MALEPLPVNDTESANWLSGISTRLSELIDVVKTLRIEFPKIYTIQGSVNIDKINMPPIQITNLSDLNQNFNYLASAIKSLQDNIVQAIKLQKLEVPKSTSIDNEISMVGMNDLLDGVEELKNGFNILIKATKESKGIDTGDPMKVEIVADLPRPTTNPVTNVSINSISGFIKTTSATVTSSLTVLPTYGVLANRRSMILYNNDAATTIYIGGSDVTTTNGLPVPPLSYSPPLDNGVKTILYGVTTGGSADVRVMEISDIATGR